MSSPAIGDWIRIPALWPGIWSVYRVLTGFKEDRWSLDEPLNESRRTLVFSYRLVNDSWQRSFSHQSCEASLVQQAGPEDQQKIQTLLAHHTELIAHFERYRKNAKPIDLVANLGFGGMSDGELKDFLKHCSNLFDKRLQSGMTMDEVLVLLRESGLNSYRQKLPQQANLQLVSPNHLVRGDCFLYTKYRTITL